MDVQGRMWVATINLLGQLLEVWWCFKEVHWPWHLFLAPLSPLIDLIQVSHLLFHRILQSKYNHRYRFSVDSFSFASFYLHLHWISEQRVILTMKWVLAPPLYPNTIVSNIYSQSRKKEPTKAFITTATRPPSNLRTLHSTPFDL